MSFVGFVIFAAVALATVLFSLFLALIISRKKTSKFEATPSKPLVTNPKQFNHRNTFEPYNQTPILQEPENFVFDLIEARLPLQEDRIPVIEPVRYFAQQDVGVSKSQHLTVNNSRITESEPTREITLQFR